VSPRFRAHGGVLSAEQSEGTLDLSVCINPFGPPSAIEAAIARADIRRYPDPNSAVGCRALAEWLGCPGDNVLLGNGAAELLWTLTRVVLAPGSKALLWQPCFSEFEAAAQACGASVVHFEWPAHAPGAFAGEEMLQALRSCIANEKPHVLYLCAPESPFGSYIPPDVFCGLAQRFPELVVVVDQSYLGLSRHAEELTLGSTLPGKSGLSNLVLVRSLTKELGTPGVRVGYLLAERQIVSAAARMRPAWTVSAAAESAAAAYPGQLPLLSAHRAELLRLSDALGDVLVKAGCSSFPTDTFYRVVQVPAPFTSAAEFRQHVLDRHGVALRDCASFGLPEHVRVAAHPEQGRLVAAFEPKKGA
jgi:histidinol-phosphate/aromatic aminotransferase/cobyric acid decarboxylase-like protein